MDQATAGPRRMPRPEAAAACRRLHLNRKAAEPTLAVLHTHMPYTTALCCLEDPSLPMIHQVRLRTLCLTLNPGPCVCEQRAVQLMRVKIGALMHGEGRNSDCEHLGVLHERSLRPHARPPSRHGSGCQDGADTADSRWGSPDSCLSAHAEGLALQTALRFWKEIAYDPCLDLYVDTCEAGDRMAGDVCLRPQWSTALPDQMSP